MCFSSLWNSLLFKLWVARLSSFLVRSCNKSFVELVLQLTGVNAWRFHFTMWSSYSVSLRDAWHWDCLTTNCSHYHWLYQLIRPFHHSNRTVSVACFRVCDTLSASHALWSQIPALPDDTPLKGSALLISLLVEYSRTIRAKGRFSPELLCSFSAASLCGIAKRSVAFDRLTGLNCLRLTISE